MSDSTQPTETSPPTEPVPSTDNKLKDFIQLAIAIAIVVTIAVMGVATLVASISPAIMAIIAAICGTVFMTAFPFVVKKSNQDELKFDISFVITMLVAGIVSTTFLPLMFINTTISMDNKLFIGVGTFAFSAIINYIINAIVSHMLNANKRLTQINQQLVQTLKDAKIDVPSTQTSSSTRKMLLAGVIVFLIFMLACTSVFAAVTITKTISASGNIVAVGDLAVYSDASGSTTVANINWGNVAPGSSVTNSIYIKNGANYPMILTFNTAGYNPTNMSSYSTVTWSYLNDTVIPQGHLVKVDLTFTAANNAPAGSFSFNIIITGTQTG